MVVRHQTHASAGQRCLSAAQVARAEQLRSSIDGAKHCHLRRFFLSHPSDLSSACEARRSPDGTQRRRSCRPVPDAFGRSCVVGESASDAVEPRRVMRWRSPRDTRAPSARAAWKKTSTSTTRCQPMHRRRRRDEGSSAGRHDSAGASCRVELQWSRAHQGLCPLPLTPTRFFRRSPPERTVAYRPPSCADTPSASRRADVVSRIADVEDARRRPAGHGLGDVALRRSCRRRSRVRALWAYRTAHGSRQFVPHRGAPRFVRSAALAPVSGGRAFAHRERARPVVNCRGVSGSPRAIARNRRSGRRAERTGVVPIGMNYRCRGRPSTFTAAGLRRHARSGRASIRRAPARCDDVGSARWAPSHCRRAHRRAPSARLLPSPPFTATPSRLRACDQ